MARLAALLATGVVGAGTMVLVGWALDVAWLKRLVSGLPTMKVNTALCFLLLGGALRLVLASNLPHRRVGRILAALSGSLAAASLAQYALGADFGIDELLFVDAAARAAGQTPGRMAVMTGLDLVLLSVALVLLGQVRRTVAIGTWSLWPWASSRAANNSGRKVISRGDASSRTRGQCRYAKEEMRHPGSSPGQALLPQVGEGTPER